MPNSTDEDDHHLGAIEAAIRETARGRAFLADYARKMRQSDTLTMLATIARLERWCADQAARLAELERRDQASVCRPSEGLGPTLHRDPALMVGRSKRDPLSAVEAIQPLDAGSVTPDRQEVRGRIEHLASAFCDFDRRAAEVSRHRRVTARFAEVSPARVGALEGGAGALVPRAVVSGATEAPSRDDGVRQHVLEEDVLDGIAEALGTRKTADNWS